ncbi:MAG TPA: hypothetical protein VMI93_04305 [Candidatus Solibacter sp.]|nr:hypothetical protein [Candidatus Solibacter sp.]
MAASQQDISLWFDRGVESNATHLIVVCDTFSYDDYPVYVGAEENVHQCIREIGTQEMQRVMEVYNLKLPKQPQLDEVRSFNY